jgi:hypothetical protein
MNHRTLLPRNAPSIQPLPSFNQKRNLLKSEYLPSPQQTNELARLWCVSPTLVTQYFESKNVINDSCMMDAVIALMSMSMNK